MSITTTIARHYAWRCLLIAIGSLVFGVWGVYDYLWSIPARERAAERGQVARLVKEALEPGRWNEHVDPARQAVAEHMAKVSSEHFGSITPPEKPLELLTEEELEALAAELTAAMESLRARHDEGWFGSLVLFNQALASGEPRHPLMGVHLAAYDVSDQVVQATANVKPPRVYDRPVQWAFILCLPFFPLYLWFYIDAKRRVYRLDEDGTLSMPEGVWRADEIDDIDMSVWMKKSIAHVVHVDGRRVKLDDYKHRNLHLIIGAIAHRLYPDQWDNEARIAKKDKTEGPVEAADAEPA